MDRNYSPPPPEAARVPYRLIPVASERAAPPSRSGRLSRPGRKVVTHFVGEGMLAHIFSLTSEDSSDSTSGCIVRNSLSYPTKS